MHKTIKHHGNVRLEAHKDGLFGRWHYTLVNSKEYKYLGTNERWALDRYYLEREEYERVNRLTDTRQARMIQYGWYNERLVSTLINREGRYYICADKYDEPIPLPCIQDDKEARGAHIMWLALYAS